MAKNNNKVYDTLLPDDMAKALASAQKIIFYSATGMTDSVAAAIIGAKQQRGVRVEVVIDYNPEVYRLGYGHHEAVSMMCENGIRVRKENGIRLGVLICDDNGWVFNIPPLLVEDIEPTAVPNAIKLMSAQNRDNMGSCSTTKGSGKQSR